MLFISGWYTRACPRIHFSLSTTINLLLHVIITGSNANCFSKVSLLLSVSCQETFSVLNERFSKDNDPKIIFTQFCTSGLKEPFSLLESVCKLLLFAGFKSKVHSSVHMDRFMCENNCQLVFLLLFLFYFLSVHWFIIVNIVKILHGDFEGRTGQEKGRDLF